MEPDTDNVPRFALLCLGLTLLALAVRIPGYVLQLFDPDEATIADQAITLRDGGRLYIDAIDRKPPLPTFLYEGTFRLFHSVDLRPVHVLAALFLAVAGCAVASDVALRSRSERVWAGVLLVTGAVAFLPDSGQGANYAHFALAPGALAIVLARRRTALTAVLAGLALAAAVLCRQTWLIGLLPAAVAIGRGRRWSHLAYFVGGFAVGGVSLLPWLPAMQAWHWIFASNEGFLLAAPTWSMVWVSFSGGLALLVGLHLVLCLGIVVRLRRAGSLRRAASIDIDLWLWWATATVAWVSGFRFFAHYWMQSLPPLVLLAAPALATCSAQARRTAAVVLAVTTALAVGAAFTPGSFRTLPDAQPLARYVAAHTSPGQPVLVWGNLPQVQWLADRPLGGALVHSDFIVGRSGNRTFGPATIGSATPGAARAMMDSVQAHPPQLIIDTSTSDLYGYRLYPLSDFPQLSSLVSRRYLRTATVEGATIYRRR